MLLLLLSSSPLELSLSEESSVAAARCLAALPDGFPFFGNVAGETWRPVDCLWLVCLVCAILKRISDFYSFSLSEFNLRVNSSF